MRILDAPQSPRTLPKTGAENLAGTIYSSQDVQRLLESVTRLVLRHPLQQYRPLAFRPMCGGTLHLMPNLQQQHSRRSLQPLLFHPCRLPPFFQQLQLLQLLLLQQPQNQTSQPGCQQLLQRDRKLIELPNTSLETFRFRPTSKRTDQFRSIQRVSNLVHLLLRHRMQTIHRHRRTQSKSQSLHFQVLLQHWQTLHLKARLLDLGPLLPDHKLRSVRMFRLPSQGLRTYPLRQETCHGTPHLVR